MFNYYRNDSSDLEDMFDGVRSTLNETLEEIRIKVEATESELEDAIKENEALKECCDSFIYGFDRLRRDIEKLKDLYDEEIEPEDLLRHLDKIRDSIYDIDSYAENIYTSDEVQSLMNIL